MSQLKAVIFGAIGTIAETSDLQRQAFNLAFAEAGLDWNWDAKTYRDLLKINGGQNRLRAYRDLVAVDVGVSLPLGTATPLANPFRPGVSDFQIAALHQSKTKHYVALLENTPLRPRTGVVELIEACREAGIQLAFCTSTSIENVNGIGAALSGLLPFERFATIVTSDKIERPKPAPDAYRYCLEQLGLTADEAIAIEDTPASLTAAKTAGLTTIATPGATTSDQDFGAADLVVADLSGITIDRLSNLLQTRQFTTSFRQRVDTFQS
jgi:HAD superfamily hydrolase (TIGR01509 family)